MGRFLSDSFKLNAQYVIEHGEDMPEIRDWRWGQVGKVEPGRGDTAGDNV